MTFASDQLVVPVPKWEPRRRPYSANDTLWMGSDLANFTPIEISGTRTRTEQYGRLSVYTNNQTSTETDGIVRPFTFTIGDEWVAVTRTMVVMGGGSTLALNSGIMFTDGTAAGSNMVGGHILISNTTSNTSGLFIGRFGTLNNNNVGAPWVSNTQIVNNMFPWVYIKLKYSAANTFQLSFSPDGITFSSFTESDISKTMTPTHVGLFWGSNGVVGGSLATFGPLQKVA